MGCLGVREGGLCGEKVGVVRGVHSWYSVGSKGAV